MSQTRAAAPASSPGCPVCCTPVAPGDERCPTCLTYLRARPPADSFACAGARVVTKVRDRLSWIMVPEAFEGLGLLAEAWRYLRWRAGRLGVAPPSRAYRRLDCPATRVELTRALLAKLATCQLPALGVSRTPVAVQRGCQGLTVRHCHRLAGRDQVVRYALPPTVGHGFVVAGRPESVDESADGPLFAAVQFAPGAQPRERLLGLRVLPVLVGLLGALLAAAGLLYAEGADKDAAAGLVLLGLTCGLLGLLLRVQRGWTWVMWLLAFLAAVIVAATHVGWCVLDVLRTAGNDAGYQVDMVQWAVALCLCVGLVGYWLSPPVRGCHGQLVPVLAVRARRVLPWRDRWLAMLASPRGLALATALLLILAATRSPRLLAHRWDFARAGIAWRLGGLAAAIDVYDHVAAGRWAPAVRRRAGALARQARLARVRHEFDTRPRGADWPASSLADLRHLVDERAELTGSERRQTADLLLAVGEGVVDAAAEDARQGASPEPGQGPTAAQADRQAPWRTARDAFRMLVTSFPEEPAAQQAADRAVWRLAWHEPAHTEPAVPVCARRGNLLAHRANGRLEVNYESHECQRPLSGRTFLVVTLELAHLGRTKQELLAGFFSVSTREGKSWPCIGLQERHAIPAKSLATGEQVTVYELALVDRKVGQGITIGPDLLPATLVFEVPAEERTVSLRLRGRPLGLLSVVPARPDAPPGDMDDGPGKPGEGGS